MRLTFTSAADSDLRRIALYLRRKADGPTALDQLTRVRATARRLTSFPDIGPPLIDEPSRTLRVRGTPYSLVYLVNADEVRILRIFHHAQDWRVEPE